MKVGSAGSGASALPVSSASLSPVGEVRLPLHSLNFLFPLEAMSRDFLVVLSEVSDDDKLVVSDDDEARLP